MTRNNAEDVAKLIEGYDDDDEFPDSVDQAILSAGPEGSFRAFVDGLKQVRRSIHQQF